MPRAPAPLVDPFGRRVKDLRLSVTDRCTFRCTYCMPEEGMTWLARNEVLTCEELTRVAAVCVERFGFGAIRITRGDASPLTSPHGDALAARRRPGDDHERGQAPRAGARPRGRGPAARERLPR